MGGLIKRLFWGAFIGFTIYFFILLFFIQGNSLIFSESNFTFVGFIALVLVAMTETATSTIGFFETKKAVKQ